MTIEDDIRAAETQLGLRLPPSYLSTLLRSTSLPGNHALKLLPVRDIDRFERREPEWLDAWMEGVRSVPSPRPDVAPPPDDPSDPATMPAEQLAETVVVSTTDDMRILLINPARINAEGEWEAWDCATWYPGAYRYRSFDDLVAALADG